jgi:hypothetical protein
MGTVAVVSPPSLPPALAKRRRTTTDQVTCNHEVSTAAAVNFTVAGVTVDFDSVGAKKKPVPFLLRRSAFAGGLSCRAFIPFSSQVVPFASFFAAFACHSLPASRYFFHAAHLLLKHSLRGCSCSLIVASIYSLIIQ